MECASQRYLPSTISVIFQRFGEAGFELAYTLLLAGLLLLISSGGFAVYYFNDVAFDCNFSALPWGVLWIMKGMVKQQELENKN